MFVGCLIEVFLWWQLSHIFEDFFSEELVHYFSCGGDDFRHFNFSCGKVSEVISIFLVTTVSIFLVVATVSIF